MLKVYALRKISNEIEPYVIGDFVWTSMDYLGEVALGSTSIVPAAKKSRSSGIPAGFKLPENVNIFDYRGKALAIIRPSGSGNVKLMAKSRDLKTGELTIQVTE
jgi:hypothetical protein